MRSYSIGDIVSTEIDGEVMNCVIYRRYIFGYGVRGGSGRSLVEAIAENIMPPMMVNIMGTDMRPGAIAYYRNSCLGRLVSYTPGWIWASYLYHTPISVGLSRYELTDRITFHTKVKLSIGDIHEAGR